jgi:hypothetical protein
LVVEYPKGRDGFMLAGHHLVLRGRYPSMRAILNELGRTGRTKGRKCHGNGRECEWKHELFSLYDIKPYIGYTNKRRRDDWEGYLHTEYVRDSNERSPIVFKYERGKGGSLVLTEEWKKEHRDWWRSAW